MLHLELGYSVVAADYIFFKCLLFFFPSEQFCYFIFLLKLLGDISVHSVQFCDT